MKVLWKHYNSRDYRDGCYETVTHWGQCDQISDNRRGQWSIGRNSVGKWWEVVHKHMAENRIPSLERIPAGGVYRTVSYHSYSFQTLFVALTESHLEGSTLGSPRFVLIKVLESSRTHPHKFLRKRWRNSLSSLFYNDVLCTPEYIDGWQRLQYDRGAVSKPLRPSE